MPNTRKIEMTELKDIIRFRAPLMPVKDIEQAVAAGGELTMEESSFSDPGEDYCAVYLHHQGKSTNVVYIPGY